MSLRSEMSSPRPIATVTGSSQKPPASGLGSPRRRPEDRGATNSPPLQRPRRPACDTPRTSTRKGDRPMPDHSSTSARSGAAAAGGAMLSSIVPPNLAAAMARTPVKGTLKDIKHVVVLMQENRSFDHYFGTLAGVRGFADPNALTLSTGKSVFYQPVPTSRRSPAATAIPTATYCRGTWTRRRPARRRSRPRATPGRSNIRRWTSPSGLRPRLPRTCGCRPTWPPTARSTARSR